VTGESNQLVGGAVETKEFYDARGWKREGGKLVDTDLFGVKEDGPIRQEGHRLRSERIRDAIKSVGSGVRFLECGCGGTPATYLADLCSHFTAVDFSARGLEEAGKALSATGVAFETQVADICKLPIADNAYDAVYSAHALYHIPDASAQASAIKEMIRVTRPGGVIVLVLANPRPLVSPLRLVKRLIADTPGISTIASKLRPPPPLPYKPMTIAWTVKQFRGKASVSATSYAIASTWMNQKISERTAVGSRVWKTMVKLEEGMPRLSARLGNYVTFIARKNG
jgi:ubiquinone/menaquinone biosynthesis C-methylase UbiE